MLAYESAPEGRAARVFRLDPASPPAATAGDPPTLGFTGDGEETCVGRTPPGSRDRMSDKFDEAKGRAKQAAGGLTGDEDLRREGKVDKASADAKGFLDKLTGKVKGLLNRDRK